VDLQELVYLLVFIVLSTLFAVASIIAGFVFGYKNESYEKSQIYECGMKLFSDAKLRYDVKYFNYALLFLLFDTLSFFLFPFAVTFNKMPLFIVGEVILFTVILLVGLLYAIQKRMLGDN